MFLHVLKEIFQKYFAFFKKTPRFLKKKALSGAFFTTKNKFPNYFSAANTRSLISSKLPTPFTQEYFGAPCVELTDIFW